MGIGFVRPHTPLHVPDKYYDMFPLDKLELDKWLVDDKKDTYYTQNISSEDKGPKYYKMLVESYGGDRELALKHFLQGYLAAVAFVDEQVGVILDGLEKSKFKDNTIVVFTSDHGWQMGEKDYLFKNSPWDESARVPMVIRTPNTVANTVANTKITHPVALIDLVPTLIDLTSLKGDNKISPEGGRLGGFSLRPFLEGKPKEWKGPNGALSIVGNFGIDIPKEKQNYSYRTENWHYIRYTNRDEELYDHIKDPYEWKNLATNAKYAKTKALLHREMNEIIAK
ncbi:sulfatase-like hydrolase/transferase [Pedobacter arcticus]|uniref:sulfatase-like hydrolase/transferase n=1 Tax=Pedobacter arcticus TaxID=752140 RepID=UPI0002F8A3DF|nr:sulfatase-like hydrolase/transferase [Pedobacter arcticus]